MKTCQNCKHAMPLNNGKCTICMKQETLTQPDKYCQFWKKGGKHD